MSDKYIIRNYPAYKDNDYFSCSYDIMKPCQDCTDCVMKQIVKQAGYCLCPEILELLDIEEVE